MQRLFELIFSCPRRMVLHLPRNTSARQNVSFLAAWGMLPGLLATAGCGTAAVSDSVTSVPIVLVDTGTQEAVAVTERPTAFPAMHPVTGKRSLMPGLYCPECRKWYPVPPLEELTRRPEAGKCPRTGTRLVADGPPPGRDGP